MNYLNIDIWLNKNEDFWKSLEIHCLTECCGILAFALDKENIQKIIVNFNELDIKNNLEKLIIQIDNSKFDKVSSELFNLYEDNKVFKRRIKNILKFI